MPQKSPNNDRQTISRDLLLLSSLDTRKFWKTCTHYIHKDSKILPCPKKSEVFIQQMGTWPNSNTKPKGGSLSRRISTASSYALADPISSVSQSDRCMMLHLAHYMSSTWRIWCIYQTVRHSDNYKIANVGESEVATTMRWWVQNRMVVNSLSAQIFHSAWFAHEVSGGMGVQMDNTRNSTAQHDDDHQVLGESKVQVNSHWPRWWCKDDAPASWKFWGT